MTNVTTAIPRGFEHVPNADIPPGRRICSLRIHSLGGTELATGWAWGFHTIVTAAHAFDGISFAQIDVFPGRNGPGPGMFGQFTTDLFERAPASVGDFAAIFVREPIGQSLGAFQLPSNSAASLKGRQIVLSGYRVADGAEEQLIGRGVVTTDDGVFIGNSDLETVRGMSGGPVWIDGVDAQIVAIHRLPNGVAVKVTSRVADTLNEWRLVEASRVFTEPVLLSPAALSLPGAGRRTAEPLSPGLAPAALEGPAASVYSDLRPVLRLADDIVAVVARARPPITHLTVQIRTQPTPWVPKPRGGVLSLEEQSLVSVLSTCLPAVAVTCPQISAVPTTESPGTKSHPGSANLDIVLCVNGNDTVGCATLLGTDGVLRDAHTWPPAPAALGASPRTIAPAPVPTGAENRPTAKRGAPRSRRR